MKMDGPENSTTEHGDASTDVPERSNDLKKITAEWLSQSTTKDNETFDQYIWRYVCSKMTLGKVERFGRSLLKADYQAVRHSTSGVDLIPQQVTEVARQWLDSTQSTPTWDQFLKALERDSNMNLFRTKLHKTLSSSKLGTAINITDFTKFVSSSIPVTSRDDVLLFGTVVLGMSPDVVQKCQSGFQPNTESPKVALDYLRHWMKNHPQQTADDLLKAIQQAEVGVGHIKTLRAFFEEQEFIPVKQKKETGITDGMKQLLQDRLNRFYQEKLKISPHPVCEGNQVEMQYLFTDPDMTYLPYDTTTTSKQEKDIPVYGWPSLFDLTPANKETNLRILISGDRGMGKTELVKHACHNRFQGTKFSKMYDHVFLFRLRGLKPDTHLSEAICRQLLEPAGIKTRSDQFKDKFEEYLEDNLDRILIIFDGYDELASLPHDHVDDSDFPTIESVIHRRNFPESHIVVTTRPEDAYKMNDCMNVSVMLNGFSEKNRREYINKFYKQHENPEEVARKILRELRLKGIPEFGQVPQLLMMVCCLWQECQSLPNSGLACIIVLFRCL